MDQINSEILRQFEAKGLTVNKGIAVDARLVKSANHPISNKQIEAFKEKTNTPEGQLDKNEKPKKYTRDLDSDWVIKNDEPHYGLKEHDPMNCLRIRRVKQLLMSTMALFWRPQ